MIDKIVVDVKFQQKRDSENGPPIQAGIRFPKQLTHISGLHVSVVRIELVSYRLSNFSVTISFNSIWSKIHNPEM